MEQQYFSPAAAHQVARLAADFLSGLDDEQNVKTLTFLSEAELDSIAAAIAGKKELTALVPKLTPKERKAREGSRFFVCFAIFCS